MKQLSYLKGLVFAASFFLSSCATNPGYINSDKLRVNLDDSKKYLSVVKEVDFEHQMRILCLTSPFEESWQLSVKEGKVHAYEVGIESYILRKKDGLEAGIIGDCKKSLGTPAHFHPDADLLWRYAKLLPESTGDDSETNSTDGPSINLCLEDWVKNWGPSISRSFSKANKTTNFDDVYALLYYSLTIKENTLLEYSPYGKKTIYLTDTGIEHLAQHGEISLEAPKEISDGESISLFNKHLRIDFSPYKQKYFAFKYEHRETIDRLTEENFNRWLKSK